MTKPCAVTLDDGSPCPEDKLPSSNKYCYWHRVAATSITSQVAEALVRRHKTPADKQVSTRPFTEWPAGHRWCAGCQSYPPLWYCTPAKGSTQLSRCRACDHAGNSRSRDLSTYGVGPERKAEIMALQKGACAGCRRGQVIKQLAMDHNHRTSAWRGILCQTCNHKVLGGAFDSAQILLNLAYYLLNPPAAEGSTWEPPENLILTLQVRRREPKPTT